MKRPESKFFSSINNIAIVCSIYILIRGYLAFLPHREADFLSFVLTSIAFLCSLICLSIYFEKGAPRPFFIIFGSFFFFYSIYFLVRFIGSSGIIGSNYDSWRVYIFIFAMVDLFLSLSVTFLAIQFTLRRLATWKVFLLSFVISIVAFIFSFQKVLFNFNDIINSGNALPLWWASIKLHFFWLAMLLLYWYNSIKSDRPLGQYINSIVFGISLYIPLDLLHMYVLLFNFEILHGFSPYWNLIIMCFFGFLLTLKLYSASNEYGKWYEQIIVFGDTHFGRRRGIFDRFIYWLLFSEKKSREKL